MPYFEMSTANPTGQRPWGFALQQGSNLGRLGRRRRMGFYFPASYPLPAATIGMGDLLPNMPTLNISSFKGKQNYGTPYPVYGAFNPTGSGRMSGARLAAVMVNMNNTARPIPPVIRYTPPPTYTVTASGMPLPTATTNITPQQQQAILAAQQTAAQNAVAAYQQQQAVAAQNSAAVVAGSPSSQIATTTVPAAVPTAPSWFTDPNQELISGFPNWGLLAAAGVGLMLMKGKR